MDNQNHNNPISQVEPRVSQVEPRAQNASVINKGLILGLSVSVVALLTIIVYLLTTKSAVSPAVQNNSSLLTPEQPVENKQAPLVEGQIYRNDKFGFELQLTDAWKGYKVFSSEGSQGVGAPTYLQFILPTVDKTKCVIDVTDEVCGYVAPFSIIVIAKDRDNTSMVDGKIGEYKGNVYYYSIYTHFNPLPEDLASKNFEIPKIISTFKFIN